jgi:hypothetical protein
MKKLVWISLLFISTMSFAQTTKDLTKFANVITAKGLKEKLSVIASAEMEGRETASPGQKRAAAFIESEFKRMGLLPGNGNSYQFFKKYSNFTCKFTSTGYYSKTSVVTKAIFEVSPIG